MFIVGRNIMFIMKDNKISNKPYYNYNENYYNCYDTHLIKEKCKTNIKLLILLRVYEYIIITKNQDYNLQNLLQYLI